MTITQTIAAPLALDHGVDPSSTSYYKQMSRPASIKPQTQKESKRSKLRKMKLRIVRTIKEMFGAKANSTFVVPNEYGALHRSSSQSSKCSRLSSPRMTVAKETNRNSAPAVLVTMPLQRGRNFRWTVHNYAGAGSPVDNHNSKQTRWSHPAVQEVVPPRTPMTATTLSSDIQDWETISNSSRSRPQTTDTLSSSLAAADGEGTIRPKTLFMQYSQSVTIDGEREIWSEFRDRLDGHKPRSDRRLPISDLEPEQKVRKQQERRSNLPYLAKASRLNPDAISNPSLEDFNEALRIHQAREEALRLLESSEPETPQGYVEAWVPKEALEHPISLVPGSNRNPRLVENRHTWSGAQGEARKYVAFTPVATTPPMPKIPEKKDKGKRAADSGIQIALDDARSATPSTSNRRHRQHYERVESGIFNDAPVLRPVPSDPSLQFPYVDSTPLTLGTRAPDAAIPSSLQGPTVAQRHVKRKPLEPKPDTMKSLPPTPAAQSLRRLTPAENPSKESLAPTPLKMTDNGYPIFLRDAIRKYSAQPKYERRSVNEVEAKYLRQKAAKEGKLDKKTPKEEKPDKKTVKQEKKIADMKGKVAKMEEARQVGESLKKLMM